MSITFLIKNEKYIITSGSGFEPEALLRGYPKFSTDGRVKPFDYNDDKCDAESYDTFEIRMVA